MRHVCAVIALALSLGACAGIGPTIPPSVQAGAYKAASVSFVAWESLQSGIESYGKLPPCGEGDTHLLLCKNAASWATLRDIEHKTTGILESSRPIIQAGNADVDLLMSIPSAVADAQSAIVSARVVVSAPAGTLAPLTLPIIAGATP